MLQYAVPPGYQRQQPIKRPKLGPWLGVINAILEDDKQRPGKQRHTAKRIFERLREEHSFTGGYTIVKDYVRSAELHSREMFIPLTHAPGEAQADFGEALVKHGEARKGRRTPEYTSWCHLKSRCLNMNNRKFPDYGGRGITVSQEWRESYPTFLADMGRRPSPAHSLDRRDNNGGYSKANCRWATAKEQANNQRPRKKPSASVPAFVLLMGMNESLSAIVV
jgi:hypothetical protein